jgi:hypothetical protein
LLAVQRDPPKSSRQKAPAEARHAPHDFFVMEPAWSTGHAEVVETTGCRLVFTGQTAVLRTFLNRLADSEFPLSVRVVEVEPVPSSRQSVPGQTAHPGVNLTGPTATEPAVPLIERSSSRFTVIVEHLQRVVPAPSAT